MARREWTYYRNGLRTGGITLISENDIIASYIKTYYPDKLETLRFYVYKAAYVIGFAFKRFGETLSCCDTFDTEEGEDDDT